MEDITLKLHIAVMLFAQDRVVKYNEAKERGFTTAELLGNAALAIGALVGIWTFFQTGVFDKVKTYVTDNLHIGWN